MKAVAIVLDSVGLGYLPDAPSSATRGRTPWTTRS